MDTIKRMAVYGCGGHGRVVAQIARACGYDEIVWIDDAPGAGVVSFEVFLQVYPNTPLALGIGGNRSREHVFEKVLSSDLHPVVLVHPSAVVAEDTRLGEGCVVMPLAVINTGAVIGAGAVINTHAVVEHECRIGRFAHVGPGAALAGAVTVGARTQIGIGSSVVQCLRIGSDSVVAAGAAVVTDLPDRVLAAGVPAAIKKELA